MIVSRSKGTSTTCHCEEAVPLPVIASQCAHWRGNPFPLCTGGFDGNAQKTQPLENGLPHQSADWFAMTVVVGTLAEPSYVSEINDHLPYHCTCGRRVQRMCVYHPKCVTHLPRALPAKRSFFHRCTGGPSLLPVFLSDRVQNRNRLWASCVLHGFYILPVMDLTFS